MHGIHRFNISMSISPSASIGNPKYVRVMAGGLEGEVFMGPKAEEHRGLLNIRYPIEVGVAWLVGGQLPLQCWNVFEISFHLFSSMGL